MASSGSITIRRLDESVKRKLRMRAASEGHSLEEEVRQILSEASVRPAPPLDLAQAIAEIVDAVGGVELDLPSRSAEREPPRFDWDEDEP